MSQTGIFKQMTAIFYAVMSGHMLFACIIVFMLKPQPSDMDDKLFVSLGGGLGLALVMIAFWLYSQRIEQIRTKDADMRLQHWKIPVIIRFAAIDGACLLNLVFLLLTGNSIFLYFYVAAAIAMLYAKPRRNVVEVELELDHVE